MTAIDHIKSNEKNIHIVCTLMCVFRLGPLLWRHMSITPSQITGNSTICRYFVDADYKVNVKSPLYGPFVVTGAFT